MDIIFITKSVLSFSYLFANKVLQIKIYFYNCKEKNNLTLSLIKSFLFENTSNLTHEFLYDKILITKFDYIFLLKLSYKNSFVKFDVFSRRNG